MQPTTGTFCGITIDPNRVNSKSYWRGVEWRFIMRNPHPERYFATDADGNARSLQRILIEDRIERATDA